MPDTYRLCSVFKGLDRDSGERHAIIFDLNRRFDDNQRQIIAAKLNLNETIFIDSTETGSIGIFNATHQIPFAGTASLAAAKFILDVNPKLRSLLSMGMSIDVELDSSILWVEAGKGTLPAWNIVKTTTSDEVNAVGIESSGQYKHTFLWSWINENKGMVRARTFASDWNIPEVNGNGSGAMKLALLVNRPIEVTHGPGNGVRILASPVDNKSRFAKLGGEVFLIDKLPIPTI